MKVYIVTTDDIEDHHPERVFSTREKAETFFEESFQEEKEKHEGLGSVVGFEKRHFYRMIVELEVE